MEGKASPRKSLFNKAPAGTGKDDKARIIYQLKAAADARVESIELAYKEKLTRDVAERHLLQQQANESMTKLKDMQRRLSMQASEAHRSASASARGAEVEIDVPGHGPIRISLACDLGVRIVPLSH